MPREVHVTFSDKPMTAREPQTVVLAGVTDEDTPLKALLLLMYKAWMAEAFQEGVQATESRIIVP